MTFRHRSFFAFPTIILLFTTGCLTSSLIYWTDEDHPGFKRIAGIEKALLDSENLFLVLAKESADQSAELPVVLRIRLRDLSFQEVTDPACTARRHAYQEVRIKVRPLEEMPVDARPIPIRDATVSHGEELKHLVATLPDEPQLIVLKDMHGVGFTSLHNFDDPTLLLVLPSAGVREVALMTDYKENRWKRRPWLLLTPVTLAGDVITFPLQLMAHLAIDC